MVMVRTVDPGQDIFGDEPAFSRYPAAAHALLPYNQAALSGASLFNSLATSPVYGVAQLARRTHAAAQLRGLGADVQVLPDGSPVQAPPDNNGMMAALGVVAVIGVAVLAAVAFAGYKTGEAIAPDGKEGKYGWYGAGAGLVGGPIGLGLLALLGGRNRED